jgi:hypothetical protein
MQITKVSVTSLFGQFDHVIPLESPDRVTIIHGPNGFGKTVMLKMIASFIEGKPDIFKRTPFDKFSVTLSDGSQRIIKRHIDTDISGKRTARLEPIVLGSDGAEMRTEVPTDGDSGETELPRDVLLALDREIPGPYRLSPTGAQWIDGVRSYSVEQILEKFPAAAEKLPKKYRRGLLFDISKTLDVFFVETNRLSSNVSARERNRLLAHYDEDPDTPIATPRVEHHSRDIVGRIQLVTAAYARRSQESDRTFPERLVKYLRDRQIPLPEREILMRMADLESKRKRLVTLGLLDSESGLRDLTEEDVRRAPEALTIYVGDMEHKLNVFEDLARRIGALVDIIRNRFKYKTLIVDRERGFRVISDRKQTIQLSDLSSGEQHELIVLYELLFRGPTNGLVLVDEPEISLHVGWQSRFLTDLIEILGLINSYAIVATHSPVVIGSRSDLTVQLKGPEVLDERSVGAREH